jgi:hypothetical protein
MGGYYDTPIMAQRFFENKLLHNTILERVTYHSIRGIGGQSSFLTEPSLIYNDRSDSIYNLSVSRLGFRTISFTNTNIGIIPSGVELD